MGPIGEVPDGSAIPSATDVFSRNAFMSPDPRERQNSDDPCLRLKLSPLRAVHRRPVWSWTSFPRIVDMAYPVRCPRRPSIGAMHMGAMFLSSTALSTRSPL
jgi:hypothetical protein